MDYDRPYMIGEYIVKNLSTIRKTAKAFNISKSTVHSDIVKRLKFTNKNLYDKVHKILLYNFSQKHIRGGEATRKRYLELNKK
jgi:putative DeoR family transcriptional regulator, stage III sporulation protein D